LETVRLSRNLTQPQYLLLGLTVPLLLLLLSACGSTGSGNVVTQTRDVGSFSSIDVGGGVHVELAVDSAATESVSVTYDDNLQDHVVTRVDGNTLIVTLQNVDGSIGSGRVVKVTMPTLEEFTSSGGSHITGTGSADAYKFAASGGSHPDLGELQASSVEIDCSGGAHCQVFASESLTGVAEGGAQVTVLGNPGTQSVEKSGGADVNVG
jgi:hypothetical protein